MTEDRQTHCLLSVVPGWRVGGVVAGSHGLPELWPDRHSRYFLLETPGTDRQVSRLTLSFQLFISGQVSQHSDLADQSWVPPVCDVILSDVTMQPITEVEKTVVQRDQDVCDQTCEDRQETSQTDRPETRPETSQADRKADRQTHQASQAASIPLPSYWEHWSPSLQPSHLSEDTQSQTEGLQPCRQLSSTQS